MKSKLFVYLPCFLFASCASIVSKSDWPVTLSSNPSGATVVVKKKDGAVVHQATTPTTVTLSSSPSYFTPAKYTVEFSKKGYPTQTVALSASLNGWYAGNIVFGGLVGILIVDPLSGAMYRLDDQVTANLAPMASLDNGSGKKLKIVSRDAVPKELQQKLVAVN